MPQVVGPENLPSELELTQQRAHLIPEKMREKLLCPKPIEFRPVTEKDPYNPLPSDPIKYVWFRADGALIDSPGTAQIFAGLRLGLRSARHVDAAAR